MLKNRILWVGDMRKGERVSKGIGQRKGDLLFILLEKLCIFARDHMLGDQTAGH